MNEKGNIMKKPLFIAIPLALSAGLMLATPASAADWNKGNNIKVELRQLDRQINYLPGLSHREEAQLERRVDNAQALLRRYSRNGLSRVERQTLNNRITAIKADMRKQSRDRNQSRR